MDSTPDGQAYVYTDKSCQEDGGTSDRISSCCLYPAFLYNINPLVLTAAESNLTTLIKHCKEKQIFKKIFNGQLLIRTSPIALLQILC